MISVHVFKILNFFAAMLTFFVAYKVES